MAAPIFAGLDATPGFTENGAPVVLDNNATITDSDNGTTIPFTGATLTLARDGGANPDDVFSASSNFSEGQVVVPATIEDPDNPGNFILVDLPIGSYTMADGTLVITFNDQATQPRVETVLRALRYANGGENPPSTVTIAYTFNNDGDIASGSISVSITAQNDAPSIDTLAGSAAYVAGSSGVVLSPNIAISDVDSPTLSGATVAFVGYFDADDVLEATTSGTGISAVYSAGTLELTGAASLELYRQVLASITYRSSAQDPSAGGSATLRDIGWTLHNTGIVNPNSVTVGSSVTFLPGIDLDQDGAGTGFAATYTEGGPAVAVADTDVDVLEAGSNIATATVTLTNAKAGDTLSAPGVSGLFTVTIDDSSAGRIVLTLTNNGSATAADFEAALHQVVFATTAMDAESRLVTVLLRDDNGPGNVATATIGITLVNDPGSAADDSASTSGNVALSVDAAHGVLANDNDPDGLSVITGTVATSQGGTIQFASDGSYIYTPANFFVGTDTVSYTAQDFFGSQVSATLSITVGPVEGTAGDDSFTIPAGSTVVNGLGGVDTVTFGFRLIDATVTYQDNKVIIDGPSSHTELTGFEIFNFTDGTVNTEDGDPLIDDLFYYARNHDVWNAHVDADDHYNSFGWQEGRDPNAFFSTSLYLTVNPDVAAAGVNPLTHFHDFGWQEGRVPSLAFDPAQYLAANPDVAAAKVDPLAHFLESGAEEGRQPFAPTELIALNGFDYVYYRAQNPDVVAAGVDPFLHFQTFGWQEDRNPNALFDTAGYLANYGDVAAAGVNPLDHYHDFGWKEGRDPSVDFDTDAYLAAYPDVAAANIDPLAHYLQFGMHEGRSALGDGVWS